MASTTISRTTSWLPVTTAFSAPAACSSIIWGAHAPWIALNDPGYGLSVDPNLTCLPPPATTWWEQNNTSIEYSIGPTIVCPQAYTTATTSVQDSSTFVACCPSNYALNTVADHGAAVQCQSHMEAGHVITIVEYKTFTNNNELDSAWVTALSTATDDAVVDGIQMNGWNFAASTTSSSSTSTASTGLGSTSITSATTATSATSVGSGSNAVSPPKQLSRLSPGAKAGIAVACALVGLAIIGGAVIYFILKKRRPNGALLHPAGGGALEESTKGYYAPPPPLQEMHAPTWRTELMTYGGHQDRAELADRRF